MKARITWKDVVLTAVLLIVPFILLPFALSTYSEWRGDQFKNEVNAAIPKILNQSQPSFKIAADILATQATTTQYPIYTQDQTNQRRVAMNTLCDDIERVVKSLDPRMRINAYSCVLTIKLGNTHVSLSRYNSNLMSSDISDTYLDHVTETEGGTDMWQIYPDGRAWRVIAKLRSEPPILAQFTIHSSELD